MLLASSSSLLPYLDPSSSLPARIVAGEGSAATISVLPCCVESGRTEEEHRGEPRRKTKTKRRRATDVAIVRLRPLAGLLGPPPSPPPPPGIVCIYAFPASAG